MINDARKAIAAALTGLAAWGTSITVSEAESVTAAEWWQLFGVLVTAFLVWLIPNPVTPPEG